MPEHDGPDPTAGLLQPFSLPAPLRDRFEDSLGVDLGGVRLHTDDTAAADASAMGARAFAHGSNIHFAAGQYQPDNPFGQHLIAHEVAHTVQQGSGSAAGAQLKAAGGSSQDSLEVEADRAADAMLAGAPASIAPSGVTGVMRKSVDDPPGSGSKIYDPSIKVDGGADKTPASDADWKSADGDSFIGGVKGELRAWRTHKAQPHSNKWPERAKIATSAKAFKARVGSAQWPAMRDRANKELGSADLAVLQELMCMDHQDFGITEVFNVTMRDVKHRYTLTLKPGYVLSDGTLEYTNDLPQPWKWSHDITVGMYGIGATFEAEIDPETGKPKGGGSAGKTKVQIDATMKATLLDAYYGWEDFPGAVSAMNPPSGGAVVGIGAEFDTGSAILFKGPNVTFDSLKLKGKVTPGLKGKIRFKISAGSLGFGAAHVSTDMADVDNAPLPELPPLVPVTFEQKAVLNMFALGSAELVPPMYATIEQLRQSLEVFRHERIEPHLPTLKKMGISPESLMHLDVELTGWASRRWEAAADDAERRKRNEKLSLERATNATQACNAALGTWHLGITTLGRGARVYSAAIGGTIGEGELIGRIKDLEQKLAEMKKRLAEPMAPNQKSALLDEQKKLTVQKADLEADLDKKKNAMDSPQDQMVNIVVKWAGKLPDEGKPAVAKPGKKASP